MPRTGRRACRIHVRHDENEGTLLPALDSLRRSSPWSATAFHNRKSTASSKVWDRSTSKLQIWAI